MNQKVWILGDVVDDHESMNIEYKEFCFKENVSNYFTKQQISRLCRFGIIPRKFNSMVLYNLRKYIDVYIPKYMCCFHNSNEQDMSFVIGVNDYNEVTGIPFNNENLQDMKEYFEHHIQKSINSSIFEKGCCDIDMNTSIQRCELDASLIDDDDMREQLRLFDQNKKWLQIRQRKYNKRKKQWVRSILKYKGKLQMVYEDREFKEEFQKYLQANGRYDQFVSTLNDPTPVINLDSVHEGKKNSDSFMYWLIRFKDQKIDDLMTRKPSCPSFPKLSNIEFSSVSHLSELRKCLIEKNRKIAYYIMLITFRRRETCCNILRYKDHFKKNWRAVRRCLNQDQTPRTNHIEFIQC
jgi:hypothetical protein